MENASRRDRRLAGPRAASLVATALVGTLAAAVPAASASSARPAARHTESTASSPAWRQFHNTVDRIGHASNETKLDPSNVGGLQMRWEAWTNSVGGFSSSSPAVADGIVYVGSNDGHVYAFDLSDGSLVWKFATGASIDSSPAVVHGIVYIGSDDDDVYALDATTGAKVWSYATGGKIGSSMPLVWHGIVYVGSRDGYFYALDATTGALVWKSPPIWEIWRGGALANGIVYVGSDKSTLYAFDADTGALKWSATLGGRVRCNPAVAKGLVYVGADDGRLYAFDANTGALEWKTPVFPNDTLFRGGPAVWDGELYAPSYEGISGSTTNPPGGHMYAFNAKTGAEKWSFTFSDMSTAPPVVADGVVYGAEYGHQAYAFDAKTGARLWASGFDVFKGITDSPAIVNGNLIFLNRNGYLYDYADLTPPSVSFDTAPAAVTNATSASFSWHASEDISGGYTCALDGRSTSCTGTAATVTSLKAGSHTFAVTATDLSGNVGTSSLTWSIDRTAPTVAIAKHPSAHMAENSATFNITSSESPATFQCQLDGQAKASCDAWPKYTNLRDGTHSFLAWSVDAAGNVSSTPASYTWLQDTVAPTISVTGPTSVSYGTSPSWTETASEPVTFYCSKDGGAYKLCPSPTSMTKPSVGTHTITWYAVDIVWHTSNYVTITLKVH